MSSPLPEVNVLGYDSDVTPDTAAPDSTTRGRPRSEDLTDTILTSTSELLHESGYDCLRMQDVADHAGVGLATIYRRWPSKEELVAASMAAKPDLGVELTGDVDADLRGFLVSLAAEIGGKGEYIAGLMSAANEHEVIGDAVRDAVCATMRRDLTRLLEAKVGPGPHIDFLIDTVPGVLMYRAGLLREAIDPDAFADEAMALVDAL